MARDRESRFERYDRSDEVRRSAKRAVDRDRVRDVLRAAGARNVDEDAVEAMSALLDERLASIASRVADAQEERDEDRLSAATVAVAAVREVEERRYRS